MLSDKIIVVQQTLNENSKMEIQKIIIEKMDLANVIDDLKRGKLKIPRFQRNFIWEKMKITNFLLIPSQIGRVGSDNLPKGKRTM